jgi:ElaB/YqjD/DUF883 family membrane-anchored ribosome-binding protein
MDTASPENGPARALSQFNDALSQAGESQRALLQDVSQFAREESLRFANLRLERGAALIDKLSNAQGVGGLIAAQQEWLRDLFSDYSAQSQRTATALRDFTHTVMASATQSAGETIDRVHQHAGEAMRQADEAMEESQNHVRAAAQDFAQEAEIAQETHH